MLRDLQSNVVGQMVVVPGIITAASKTYIKAIKIVLRCVNCGHEKDIKGKYGYGGYYIPRICDNAKNPGLDKQPCKLDTY